jgi:hypothetical protein
MTGMPDAPDDQTRTAVTQRIADHIHRGWPRLKAPVVHHRGQFCYVAAVLQDGQNPVPLLRLRYQGSPDKWRIAIYLASDDCYSETELPTTMGPVTGTPEEGIDLTLPLYVGPVTQR